MLKGKEKKEFKEMTNSSNTIGKGTIIEGNISSVGNIRMDGEVVGDVITKSKVVLGDSSRVKGKVLAQNAEIAGEVNGIVEVAELLILKPSAVINGDISTNKIIVESGAVFNGACNMGVSTKEIKIEGGQRSERSA